MELSFFFLSRFGFINATTKLFVNSDDENFSNFKTSHEYLGISLFMLSKLKNNFLSSIMSWIGFLLIFYELFFFFLLLIFFMYLGRRDKNHFVEKWNQSNLKAIKAKIIIIIKIGNMIARDIEQIFKKPIQVQNHIYSISLKCDILNVWIQVNLWH